mgnify:FL=1
MVMERVKVKKAKKEKILWKDSKTILGIRVPTEQYTLTGTKLSVRKGIFSIRDDECQLYNVYDIKLERSFLNRLLGTGTITIFIRDATDSVLALRNIRDVEDVKEQISELVQSEKERVSRLPLRRPRVEAPVEPVYEDDGYGDYDTPDYY